jgi:TfoX/Sxy family transcriptional regulator of competence genes
MVQRQPDLADRVRLLLPDRRPVREAAMFGGRSFMVDEKMIASARRNGDLLVRVAAERHDELVAVPGAAPAEMGTGRRMGPGWISVSADSITDDERLAFWIGFALEHNESAGKARS